MPRGVVLYPYRFASSAGNRFSQSRFTDWRTTASTPAGPAAIELAFRVTDATPGSSSRSDVSMGSVLRGPRGAAVL